MTVGFDLAGDFALAGLALPGAAFDLAGAVLRLAGLAFARAANGAGREARRASALSSA